MAGRDRSKDASLAASRTLNPHPEAVTDPAFTSGAFFDPADLVQVKYEMVRAVEAGALDAGAAASAFGLARQSYYNARKALAEHGLPGLIPALETSCAASPPAGSAAAGGTGRRSWPPRGWRPGWPARPRGPPSARPQAGVTAQQRRRRLGSPHPPPASPCPPSRRKEARTPAQPARRRRPP